MSERARELAGRNAMLRLRCAVQRRAVAQEVWAIESRLQSVDRVVALARSAVLHPAVIAAGAVALVLIGRARGAGALRLISQGWLLVAAARRVLRLAKKL